MDGPNRPDLNIDHHANWTNPGNFRKKRGIRCAVVNPPLDSHNTTYIGVLYWNITCMTVLDDNISYFIYHIFYIIYNEPCSFKFESKCQGLCGHICRYSYFPVFSWWRTIWRNTDIHRLRLLILKSLGTPWSGPEWRECGAPLTQQRWRGVGRPRAPPRLRTGFFGRTIKRGGNTFGPWVSLCSSVGHMGGNPHIDSFYMASDHVPFSWCICMRRPLYAFRLFDHVSRIMDGFCSQVGWKPFVRAFICSCWALALNHNYNQLGWNLMPCDWQLSEDTPSFNGWHKASKEAGPRRAPRWRRPLCSRTRAAGPSAPRHRRWDEGAAGFFFPSR